jgi:hypothetical protein
MDEKSHVHFLKISGLVANNKKKEFEQTVQFVFNQLPAVCTERSLAIDFQKQERYYFYSVWQNESSLKKFMESEEYQLIRGAYEALGYYEKTVFGPGTEIKYMPDKHS